MLDYKWLFLFSCWKAMPFPQSYEFLWVGISPKLSNLCVLSRPVVSSSLQSHGLEPSRVLCPWGFSRQEYWSGLPCPPPGDLPNPGIKLKSPALQEDSLLSEPLREPKNDAVDNLSLLQGIFLTQELNQGFLHWRQILYQLSYQRSPWPLSIPSLFFL